MKQTFRIGIDARLYRQTGVGRYTRFLIEELSKIDKRNEYILFMKQDNAKQFSPPYENFTVRIANIHWHTLREQIFFPKILQSEKLDLVHFPYFSIPVSYKRPYIVTIHDLTPLTHVTGKASTLPKPLFYLKHMGYRFVLSKAITKACHIIVPTHATKNAVAIYYPEVEHKVSVTQEGVCIVRPARKTPMVKGQYFLYVGNAYPHKNVETLINAFTAITKKVTLVLVGEEDYFYRRLKESVNDDRIIFFGQANDQTLANLYSHALALVLPSLTEGFGLPALEAMAYGCLVIASKIPALQEVCGDVAIYIDPCSKKSITNALQTVLQCKNQFASYLKRGEKRAQIFKWSKMVKQTYRIYEHCLGVR